jgi:hypothetical protein
MKENKIKPFADVIRAKLRELKRLDCAEFIFGPQDWFPSYRFWETNGQKLGAVFLVRNYDEKTYVLRVK